jgi:hypothetical protein
MLWHHAGIYTKNKRSPGYGLSEDVALMSMAPMRLSKGCVTDSIGNNLEKSDHILLPHLQLAAGGRLVRYALFLSRCIRICSTGYALT